MTSVQDLCPTVSSKLVPGYTHFLPATAAQAQAEISAESARLAAERGASQLDVGELTVWAAGGPDAHAERTRVRGIMEAAAEAFPALGEGLPSYTLARKDAVANAHARQRALLDAVAAAGYDATDPEEVFKFRRAVYDSLPEDLQWVMFTPNIETLFAEEQAAQWGPAARSYAILGAYAQTELGHGSNVRGLETTATYDAATDEFVIQTPSLSALKWWPGCLGKTANYAVVYARLIIGDNDHGIHNFLVPLRDPESHELLPGVYTGDIGPKLGYNNQDNGWALFDGVRIPRTYMAMKYARVENGGKYVPAVGESRKLLYLTMLGVRAFIVMSAGNELSKAATIAVRYSAIRLQGFKDGSKTDEYAVLDYPLQQYRLLPLVAASYVFNAMGKTMHDLHGSVLASIDDGSGLDLLPDLHATSSGLKAVCSTIAAAGIEEARLACGGHGYLKSSGLPDLWSYYVHTCTVEGDNYLITGQTARYLLKIYAAAVSAGTPEKTQAALAAHSVRFAYLERAVAMASGLWSVETATAGCPEDWLEPSIVVNAHAHRAAYLLARLAGQMQDMVLKDGVSQVEAWRRSLIEINQLVWAHSMYVLVQNHFAVVDASDLSAPSAATLTDLGLLFGLHQIESNMGEFLEDGYLNSDQAAHVRSAVRTLLRNLRPAAVDLTDAFEHPDASLGSTLGRFDGDVYRALFVATSYSTLNADDPSKTFAQSLAPLMRAGRQRMAASASPPAPLLHSSL